MGHLLSYNVHGEVADKDASIGFSSNDLIEHLKRIRPNAVLVLRNFDLVQRIAKALPQTRVIIRYWNDDAVHVEKHPDYKSAAAWINQVKNDWDLLKKAGITNVSFYTTNEPGKNSFADLIRWHTNLDDNGKPTTREKGVMDYAVEFGIPLTVCNLAIGAINENEFGVFRPILWRCAQHDNLFTFGTHEYFTGLPSSGMPYLDGNGKPYFKVQPHEWPREPDLVRWHTGRHQFLLDVCDKNGIPRGGGR